MNKSGIIVLGILSIMVVVAASGCTSTTSSNNSNSQVNNTPTPTPIPTPTPTPTSTSASYQTITVGGLKCQIDSSQAGGQTSSGTGMTTYNSPDESLSITVYTDPSKYQEDVNFAAEEPGTQKVTQTISGHQVTSYSATDMNGKAYLPYFFKVAGKQVGIIQDGTSINNHLVESFYNLN